MHILFVHGMGRSPLSAAQMLFRFRKVGFSTSTFGYFAASQSAESIQTRLCKTISDLACHGDYIVIGHSLGGVLLRGAMAQLPPETRLPKQVFLLGSPISASRMAQKLARHWPYRLLTSDCGQLLASNERMAQIASLTVPTTSIIGVTGLTGIYSPFKHEENDGIVAVSETYAAWIGEVIRVPVIHTFLPSSKLVSNVILKTQRARKT
jgi:hypothetical protein